MKKLVLLGFAGICLLTACKNGTKNLSNAEVLKKAADMPGVNAGTGTFDIVTPTGWKRIDTSLSGLQATLLMSPDGSASFRSNVNVISQAMSGMAADAFIDANFNLMAQQMQQFKQVEKGNKEINGLKAQFLHYTEFNGGQTLDQILYIIPSGNIAYFLTCTTQPDRMAKEKDNFDQAVNSFKVKQ